MRGRVFGKDSRTLRMSRTSQLNEASGEKSKLYDINEIKKRILHYSSIVMRYYDMHHTKDTDISQKINLLVAVIYDPNKKKLGIQKLGKRKPNEVPRTTLATPGHILDTPEEVVNF
jgi:hypothetical protein